MSGRVPLVRVEGKIYNLHPNLSLTEERFAQAAPLDRDARDQIARDAERRYGLGACLYFYAGYACPEFGTVVLAYHPTLADGRSGNASSFDTGGMFKGYIQGTALNTEADRDALVAADLCALGLWETRLTDWVSTHFSSLDDYLNNERPRMDDPSGRLLHPRNDRRAWTFEVRLHDDVPLFDHLAFAIVKQPYFQSALSHALRASPADHDRLLDLVHRGLLRVTPDDPCVEATPLLVGYPSTSGGTR